MGVAVSHSRGDGISLLVDVSGTSVNDGSAVCPGTQRVVAIAIGQRVVCRGQSELTVLCKTAIDKNVFVFNLTDRRSLEEAEVACIWLLETRNHSVHHLSARLYGTHRGRVDFSSVRVPESPIAINLTVIIYENCGVETIDAIHLIGVFRIPVAYLERSVRTVALGNQTVAIACLVVREEPVCLLAC